MSFDNLPEANTASLFSVSKSNNEIPTFSFFAKKKIWFPRISENHSSKYAPVNMFGVALVTTKIWLTYCLLGDMSSYHRS